MNVTIRKAGENDVPAIISLAREFASFQGSLDKFTNTETQMKREQHLFDCLLAEDETGEAIGMALYSVAYYLWVGKSLYLDDLYVKESHRGQKVGEQLLRRVLSVAKEEHCQRVRWVVSGENASAMAFYKKHGATVRPDLHVCTVDSPGLLAFSQPAE